MSYEDVLLSPRMLVVPFRITFENTASLFSHATRPVICGCLQISGSLDCHRV
jgi:hypothetical protein